MKMKRIANNVALQTIGYVISGFTNVYIYVRNESCINDDDEAVLYWRAYLDGARAQKKEVQ